LLHATLPPVANIDKKGKGGFTGIHKHEVSVIGRGSWLYCCELCMVKVQEHDREYCFYFFHEKTDTSTNRYKKKLGIGLALDPDPTFH
jgi:hypothetical protein